MSTLMRSSADSWQAGLRCRKRLLLRGAAMKSAELVGIGQVVSLDLDTELREERRVQFDRPIGSFQGVHHHCAEMSCRP